MAAQNPPCRLCSTTQRSIALYRFHRVLGARRQVAAGWRKRRRNPSLINPQQPESERFHLSTIFVHYLSAIFLAIKSNARPTSSSTTENSTVNTDFFGLMTTSTGHVPI